jgi:hypothetical protein
MEYKRTKAGRIQKSQPAFEGLNHDSIQITRIKTSVLPYYIIDNVWNAPGISYGSPLLCGSSTTMEQPSCPMP